MHFFLVGIEGQPWNADQSLTVLRLKTFETVREIQNSYSDRREDGGVSKTSSVVLSSMVTLQQWAITKKLSVTIQHNRLVSKSTNTGESKV